MSRFVLSRAALVPLAVCAIAATSVAAIVSTSAFLPIPGVDAQGNPSPENSGTGTGKLYRNTSSGIVVGVFNGKVINTSGASATFTNQGIVFGDPWTEAEYTASADSERVFFPNPVGFSRATLLVIYNPAAGAP